MIARASTEGGGGRSRGRSGCSEQGQRLVFDMDRNDVHKTLGEMRETVGKQKCNPDFKHYDTFASVTMRRCRHITRMPKCHQVATFLLAIVRLLCAVRLGPRTATKAAQMIATTARTTYGQGPVHRSTISNP